MYNDQLDKNSIFRKIRSSQRNTMCNVTLGGTPSGRPLVQINLNSDEEFWTGLIPEGEPLQDIFHDGTLLKYHGGREIFVVINGTRHSVPNMQVFWSLGKDLSEVREHAPHDIEFIPLGESL